MEKKRRIIHWPTISANNILAVSNIIFALALILTYVFFFNIRKIVATNLETLLTTINEIKNSEITFAVVIDDEFPIRTEIPIDITVQAPIQTTIPVDTIVNVPIAFPVVGNVVIKFPISTNIAVDLLVDVPINESIFIDMTVPVSLEIPIELVLAETPLLQVLDDLTLLLIDLRSAFFINP